MWVTDRVSEQLAELHLTLGEGAGHDVLAAAAPVLPADLGDGASGRGDPRSGDCLLLADTATVLLLDDLDGKRAADGDGDGSEPEMWPGGQSPISRCIG
jgi:hypothetical protein